MYSFSFPFMNEISLDLHYLRLGDRILLGLSGGKDSLTLLHTLLTVQKILPPERYVVLFRNYSP